MDFCPFEKIANDQTLKVVSDKGSIGKIIEGLRLDSWRLSEISTRSMPEFAIYIDDNMHINLEGQTADGSASWMSIKTADVSGLYIVPNDVYNSIVDECKRLKN